MSRGITRLVRRPASPARPVIRLASRTYLSGVKARYGLPSTDLSGLGVGLPTETMGPQVMDDICLPPYYGSADHDDYHPLMAIVRARQPRVVLELGTAHGNTVANICAELPETRVYTVNAPAEHQTGVIVTFSLDEDEIGRAYRAHGFGSRVTQILGNTMDVNLGDAVPAGEVDLAIIDACHDTKYVLNDFKKVVPVLSGHAVVLLHDTHPSMESHLRGSYLACMRLRKQGYDIRHLRNTWWGAWRRDGWGGST